MNSPSRNHGDHEVKDMNCSSTARRAGERRRTTSRVSAVTRTARLSFIALCAGFAHLASAQTDLPLLQMTDLVYQGAFRVPVGSSDNATLAYGGTALGYNATNNSLFMTGHDQRQPSVEVKIPALVNSTDLSKLATATLLQSFADPTEGKLSSINNSDPNAKKIGGHLVYKGKLYVTGYSYYDGSGTQSTSHFSRPLDLSAKGQVVGPVRVGSQYPGFVHGYMTPVPAEWQSAFGGPVLTGHCCLSITGHQSNGPAVSVFDPEKIGQVSPVPATAVLGYPYPQILGPGETTGNRYFNLATKIKGVVFPNGTRSVLFFGRQGTGKYCYGEGSTCGDPSDPYKGTHAYPYVYQIWAYDANDLLAVKNGSKQQHTIQPYGLWNFTMPFEKSQGTHLIGGAAYDPSRNLVYISQECADNNCSPIIHAFKVAAGTAVVKPRPPADVSTS